MLALRGLLFMLNSKTGFWVKLFREQKLNYRWITLYLFQNVLTKWQLADLVYSVSMICIRTLLKDGSDILCLNYVKGTSENDSVFFECLDVSQMILWSLYITVLHFKDGWLQPFLFASLFYFLKMWVVILCYYGLYPFFSPGGQNCLHTSYWLVNHSNSIGQSFQRNLMAWNWLCIPQSTLILMDQNT